ncbi:alpha/beta fold hydrolase [Roseivirga sp. E12]|uniref:alpha/beta fold hydrolase n=1 Tax=Roseivirga sp. E12 TaxID=2819237 RepID=UPI001ABC06F9|nr:alpha/beta hydrolase [Roseivirga sp. E12]MBO3699189.1 alpha/beta hydrolase [Roseivirga sp. E12]
MKQRILKLSIVTLISVALAIGNHLSYGAVAPGIKTRVIGKGQPVIMIPGLTCDGAVWDDTIEAMGNGYQYHVMTLPGFAGNAPLEDLEAGFFKQVEAMVLNYIDENNIEKPIIIGHSLGGFMALNIAIKRPDLPSKLVIVDSLPYLTKIQMPQAETPEQVKQMADQMKNMIRSSVNQPRADKVTFQKQMLQSMIIDKDKIEIAAGWGADSDTHTIAQSMYEMYTTDIRDDLDKIKVPTLVLGAWVAYQAYGSTRESTLAQYTGQYEKLANVTVDMTDIGNHFIMWDDPAFFYGWLKKFL